MHNTVQEKLLRAHEQMLNSTGVEVDFPLEHRTARGVPLCIADARRNAPIEAL